MHERNGAVCDVTENSEFVGRIPRCTGVQGTLHNSHLVLRGTNLHGDGIVVDEELASWQEAYPCIGYPVHSLVPSTERAAEHMCAVPCKGSIHVRSKMHCALLGKLKDRGLRVLMEVAKTNQLHSSSNRNGTCFQIRNVEPNLLRDIS